jgi:transcriptional regulator with XRE-family HTH domain
LTETRGWNNNAARMADAAATETIGQRIRRLRLERGLSQRQLSAPGISYAYLSRIEAGQRTPSLKAIRILARKLGVSPELIETGARVPFAAERELRLADAELELRLDRDLDRAEEVFRAEAERDDEPALEARASAGLGLLASMRGDNAETIRQLEAATSSGYFPPETRPDLYRALGVAYSAVGASNRALALFRDCLEELGERAPHDATLRVRFGVYLASAYSAVGDVAQARRTLTEASEHADEAASSEVRINLYWALARDAWMQADSEGALAHMRRAIGLLESSEDSYNLALAHLLSAQMMSLDGRGEEADRHLEHAERLLVLRGDSSDLGLLRAEQAKRAAVTGRPDDALVLAEEARRLVGEDARYLGAALHALGAAHRSAGAPAEAEECYAQALEVLGARRQWREAAQTAREWAFLVREQGRADEAFELMDRATVLSVRHVGDVQTRRSRESSSGRPKSASD